mmetsp:Transcript_6761/g.28372  ORF Transcript_6761/g.28372 Transcript_6761/m.28372 type:complete len:301 (+) Transcript_6761:468-1370(+)
MHRLRRSSSWRGLPGLQLLAQPGLGAQQLALERAERPAQHQGRFAVAEVGAVAQQQGMALWLSERRQCPVEVDAPIGGGGKVVMRSGLGRGFVRRGQGRAFGGQRGVGQPGQPGAKARLAAELRQGAPGAHKGLLGEVVGTALVAAADAAEQLAQIPLMRLHQGGKGRPVTGCGPGHQAGLLRRPVGRLGGPHGRGDRDCLRSRNQYSASAQPISSGSRPMLHSQAPGTISQNITIRPGPIAMLASAGIRMRLGLAASRRLRCRSPSCMSASNSGGMGWPARASSRMVSWRRRSLLALLR